VSFSVLCGKQTLGTTPTRNNHRCRDFSPERVAEKLRMWQAYVAIVDGVVVGTASVDGHAIRGV
jgi:hypothetical protein